MYTPNLEASINKITDQGDRFYLSKQYNLAFMAYSEAIFYEKKENPNKVKRAKKLSAIYAKRSISCLKLADYKKCLEDAQCACIYHKEGDPKILDEMKKLKQKVIENHIKTDLSLASISEVAEEVMEDTPWFIDENLIINTTFLVDREESFSDSSASIGDLVGNMTFDFSDDDDGTKLVAQVLSKIKMDEEDEMAPTL